MKKELFKVIKSPHLTEKVSGLMKTVNQYAFRVDKNSTKFQIKKAIEEYFSVNVEEVNIVRVKGKKKRSRYKLRKQSDWKKAYITVSEGQSIDMGIE